MHLAFQTEFSSLTLSHLVGPPLLNEATRYREDTFNAHLSDSNAAARTYG